MILNPPIVRQPSETFPLGVDFAVELAAGETIVQATSTVTAKHQDTGADATGDVLTGTPVVSDGETTGSVLSRQTKASAPVGRYLVEFRATTSAGNVYEAERELLIVER